MEKNKKHWYEVWQTWVGVATTILIAAGWLYDRGSIDTMREFNGRVFTTPEEKVQTVEHIKIAPREADFIIEKRDDSIFRQEVKSLLQQATKDNYDVKKHIHHLDSINQLTADQIYQMTQEVKAMQQ